MSTCGIGADSDHGIHGLEGIQVKVNVELN